MNSLHGKIVKVETKGTLSLVSVQISDTCDFESIVLETPETAAYLQIDNSIGIHFKETEVILGTNAQHQISLQNRIVGEIIEIERGTLLSKIVLDTEVGQITSIISTSSMDRLALKDGSKAVAMIKMNEIMLSEK